MADDEISNLQGEFSKLSWDDSLSPTTNTLADIGQNTPDNDILDIVAGITYSIDPYALHTYFVYKTYFHIFTLNTFQKEGQTQLY